MAIKRHLSIWRKPVLTLLKLCNRDISIKHHWVKQRLLLNLYQHKGYWYHGKERERANIENCYRLLSGDDVVFEVGGHIGYLSQIYASIAKKVVVFEPGQNNLRYLRHNTSGFSNVQIVEKAVSDENGSATFYLDPLTGQNNSLLKDYRIFHRNQSFAADRKAAITETKVELLRLDDFAEGSGNFPTFVKIDVEGAESKVLKGMERITVKSRPKIMIEVSENHQEVEQFLRRHSYDLRTAKGEPVTRLENCDNIFGLPMV